MWWLVLAVFLMCIIPRAGRYVKDEEDFEWVSILAISKYCNTTLNTSRVPDDISLYFIASLRNYLCIFRRWAGLVSECLLYVNSRLLQDSLPFPRRKKIPNAC